MDTEKYVKSDGSKVKSEEDKIKDKFLSNVNYKPYIKCIKYILGIIIICFLIYVMYTSFYNKQLKEPFIEKTVKSEPASDTEFDKFSVDDEVCSLRKKQEDYLVKLNKEKKF